MRTRSSKPHSIIVIALAISLFLCARAYGQCPKNGCPTYDTESGWPVIPANSTFAVTTTNNPLANNNALNNNVLSPLSNLTGMSSISTTNSSSSSGVIVNIIFQTSGAIPNCNGRSNPFACTTPPSTTSGTPTYTVTVYLNNNTCTGSAGSQCFNNSG